MKKYGVVVLGVFALSVAHAQVKLDMKPGLWENTIKMTGDGAQQMQAVYADQMKQAMAAMKDQMAKMTPEQRKMMEEAMSASGMQVSENGVVFDDGRVSINEETTVVKNCVTQEQIDTGVLPQSDDEDCESKLTVIDKNHFKSTEVCKDDSASTSVGDIKLHSPTHYTGTGKTTHQVDGKTLEMTFVMEGKWLASDCGDVEPD